LRAPRSDDASFDHFSQTLRKRRSSLAVIAEVKRISPASGVLVENFDPVAQALRYVAAGSDGDIGAH